MTERSTNGAGAEFKELEAQVLFEQVSAVLEAQGIAVGQDVAEALLPLLSGEQDFAQNRAALLAMIEQLET